VTAAPVEGTVTIFRPRRARQVIYPSAALIALAMVGGAVIAPSGGRGAWGLGSRLALVATAAVVVAFLHRLADVRVVAGETHVDVVNIVHRRRLEYAEVVGVRLLRDDPWMMLDLSDGEPLAAMGVQQSDGEYAREQTARFARLVAEHSPRP
jgi:hypothetical protein